MNDTPFEQWESDPAFQQLPVQQKLKAYIGFFDKNWADDEFRALPAEKQASMKQEFLKRYAKPVEQKESAIPTQPTRTPMPMNPIAQKIGALETLASMATGIPAQLAGGLAFLGSLPRQSERQINPQETMQAVQQGLTYEPRTEAGKKMTEAVGAPFKWLEEKAAPAVGEKVADVTGSPELGALAHTGVAGFPWLLPFAPKVIKGLSQSIRNSDAFRRATIKERAMVIQDLKDLLDNPQNIKEGLTEADIVRRYGGKYFEQALERRRSGETSSVFEDIIEQPVPQETSIPLPEQAPYHPDFELGTGEIKHPYPGLGPRVISGETGEQLKAPEPEYPETPVPEPRPLPILPEPPKYPTKPKQGNVSAIQFMQKAKEGPQVQTPVTEQADRFRAVTGTAKKQPIMPISSSQPLPLSVTPETAPEVPPEPTKLPTTESENEPVIVDQAEVKGEVPPPSEVSEVAPESTAQPKVEVPVEPVKEEGVKVSRAGTGRKRTPKDAHSFIDWNHLTGGVNPNEPGWKGEISDIRWGSKGNRKVPAKGFPKGFWRNSAPFIDEKTLMAIRDGWLPEGSTPDDFYKALERNPKTKFASVGEGKALDKFVQEEMEKWTDEPEYAEQLDSLMEERYGSSEVEELERQGTLTAEDKIGSKEDVEKIGREYGLSPEEEDALIRKAEQEAPWLFEKDEPAKPVVSEETQNKIRSFLSTIEGVKDVEKELKSILEDEDFLNDTLSQIEKESKPKEPVQQKPTEGITERKWFGEVFIPEQRKTRPFHEFKEIPSRPLPLLGSQTEKRYKITLVDGTKLTVKESDIRSFPEAESPEGGEVPDTQTQSMFPDLGPGPSEKGFLAGLKEKLSEERGSISFEKKAKPDDLMPIIRSLQPKGQERALVSISELRDKANMPYEDFDKALVKLAQDGKVFLHEHDFPSSLKEDKRNKLLSIKTDSPRYGYKGRQYFVGVVPR